MIVDPYPAQTNKEVRQFLNKVETTLRVLEESTQHSDRAELYIGLMKSAVGKDMRESNSPMRLWCYACERQATIMTLTDNNLFQLQGQNPYMETLVRWVTSLTCVIFLGMNGSIFAKTLLLFQSSQSSLVFALDQKRMKEMKCVNGYFKKMDR